MSGSLSGKSVMITGATAGIGLESAVGAAGEGAFVIGTGRDEDRCAAAREMILRRVPDARVVFACADLASQQGVRSLATQVLTLLEQDGRSSLDVLVNNAGTYCGRKTFTTDGIEKTLAVNHLAPFYLTHLLLPLIQAAPVGRVVTVSSNSHYHATLNPERVSNPLFYFGLWAYQSSKLANVLFSAEFNRRNSNPEVQAFAVDPGLVNTDIGLKETGPLARLVWRQRQQRGTSADIPARTILHVAAEPGLLGSNAVYWKDSAPLQPAKKALDPDLARRLWEESCRLCGIGGYFAGSSG